MLLMTGQCSNGQWCSMFVRRFCRKKVGQAKDFTNFGCHVNYSFFFYTPEIDNEQVSEYKCLQEPNMYAVDNIIVSINLLHEVLTDILQVRVRRIRVFF